MAKDRDAKVVVAASASDATVSKMSMTSDEMKLDRLSSSVKTTSFIMYEKKTETVLRRRDIQLRRLSVRVWEADVATSLIDSLTIPSVNSASLFIRFVFMTDRIRSSKMPTQIRQQSRGAINVLSVLCRSSVRS